MKRSQRCAILSAGLLLVLVVWSDPRVWPDAGVSAVRDKPVSGGTAYGGAKPPAGPIVSSVSGARTVPGDEVISFNIIIATTGRFTLQPALESIASQLNKEDYLTVISDANHQVVAEVFSIIQCACTKLLIQNAEPLGWWGHGSRTRWQKLLPGTFHQNGDDDDLYPPGTMASIRAAVKTLDNTMYVFRMIRRWDGKVELIPPLSATSKEDLRGGQMGTPCAVYRAARDLLPDWTGRYGGDGDFFLELANRMNVTFVPAIIYHFQQKEDLMQTYAPKLLAGEAVKLP